MQTVTYLLKIMILINVKYVLCQSEFKSAPTTVKAPENDTVLLPCYLDTITNGKKLKIYILI